MTRPPVRDTLQRDEGAGTVEYIGILTIGALLVTAVLVALPALDPAARARTLACQIADAFSGGDGGGCASSGERGPEDFIPPEQCVYIADGAGWQGSIAVGVQVDGGGTWLIEELGDETFRLTRGSEAGVGAEVGVGFDVSWQDGERQYGLGASAGAAGTLVGSDAEVFLAQDRDEVDRILAAQSTDDVKSGLLGDDSIARNLWDDLFGSAPEEHLEPVETIHAAGLEVNASAGALLGVAPAEAEVTGGIYVGWVERADGTRTDSWSAASDGTAMAAFPTGTDRYDPASMDDYQVATASYAGSASFEVDRDADGNPVAIRTVTVGMGHADTAEISGDDLTLPTYTETRVQMPLETAADRELAARIADGLGIHVAGINDDTLGFGSPDTLFGLGDSFASMAEEAKQRGHYWVQEYTQETTVDRGGNVDAKWVLEAGLSGSYYETARVGTGYEYWNGQDFVSRSGCQ
ncbi:hypothetical protein [Cellulomonas sp. S1-8]|uniref:hypothetical protein n=1 Tax=Cellulomonas sp. S1-8 TaxID=2904790 RepID=UPI0022445F3C|nr:hypothetical protein [Cellulomonas sp. S1-8]UZN02149.1 hypothetical protein OKX07_13770 [Cellulomonas sp. S1-8]